uniref:SAGA-associated factor 11 n=1 Tax=Angiostrongylus cantonensis TaxID=6313 RepID=A0A0K0DBB2_ANGCA
MASPYVASGSLSQEDLHRMLSPRLAKLSAERDRDQHSLRSKYGSDTNITLEAVESFNVRGGALPETFRDVVVELSDYLLDSAFLDCIFDVHREAAILHRHGLQIDSPPPTPNQAVDSPQSSSDTPRSRPPESSTPITVKCRVCGRMVGAKVFEKHIISCRKLDGSRSSSRAAAKKIAEQEMIAESTFNDDDFASPITVPASSGDDEEWSAPKKRRRTRKRKL